MMNNKNEDIKSKFTDKLKNETILSFKKKEIEILLDELTYLLTLEGLDEKGNVNSRGTIIEGFIDILSKYYYDND